MAWLLGPTGIKTTHFWGPVANWGLAGSGAYDALLKGPEIINERMSATQVVYSTLFARFAWCVQPRNYILLSCHMANVGAQTNQLRRWAENKLATGPEGAAKVQTATLGAGAVVAGLLGVASRSVPSIVRSMAEHPAGPFYVHFWAPNFKWA